MRTEGLQPDSYTHSALLNAHSKAGRCDHALRLLDRCKESGQRLTVRAWTAVIDACARAEPVRWQKALQTLKDMQQSGIRPTVVTYNAVMTALGRGGQCDAALKLFNDMRLRGLIPDAVTYSAAMYSCSNVDPVRHETALMLLREMLQKGIRPDVIAYCACISALGRGGQLQRALQLATEMEATGLSIELQTYNILIDACGRGSPVSHATALRLYAQMRNTGVTPDEFTYASMLNVMFASSRYAAADTLYAQAFSDGLPTPWCRGQQQRNRLDFHDFKSATCMTALRMVLSDMVKASRTVQHISISGHTHDPTTDLYIITGHAETRTREGAGALRPLVSDFFQKLGMTAQQVDNNRGMLRVSSADLQKYIASVRSGKHHP